MDLADVIGKAGVQVIEASGSIRRHAVGDAGRAAGESTDQDDVAEGRLR